MFLHCRIGLAHIGRVGSVFVTVSVTIERYYSVCQPTSEFRFKWLLIPLPIICAFIYNIPKFFELEMDATDIEEVEIPDKQNLTHDVNALGIKNYIFDNQSDQYYTDDVSNITEYYDAPDDLGYHATRLRQNYWYVVLYVFWSKFIFVDIIPWVTVIVLNFRICKQIQEFRRIRRTALGKDSGKYLKSLSQKVFYNISIERLYIVLYRWYYFIPGNDHREAKILLSIVMVFVICQSFTIVADVYEALHCVSQDEKYSACYSNDHIENIIDIAHFMLSINSSINFLLYVIHDKIFRDAFIKVRRLHIYISWLKITIW